MGKKLKVGVKEGGGPPPGYRWGVLLLDACHGESREFLDDDQYAHVADQLRALAVEADPRRPATVDVRPIQGFFELRDKGGILGKINVRVYFTLDEQQRQIVALAAIKKEDEGRPSQAVITRVERRMRAYRQGQLGRP